jgi:hypothetical protein
MRRRESRPVGPPSAIGKPKDMAKLYIDQIGAANLEIVRLDITRLRIEAKQPPT